MSDKALEVLHEYTGMIGFGEDWKYRVARVEDGLAIQVKNVEGDGWSTVSYGTAPAEIVRLALLLYKAIDILRNIEVAESSASIVEEFLRELET